MTRPSVREPRLLARIAQCAVVAVALVNVFRVEAIASDHAHPTGGTFAVLGKTSEVYVNVYTAAIIVFVLWFRRCRWNMEVFSPSTASLARGWAIGAWFVPVLNLWWPRRITLDMIRASESDTATRTGNGLVNAWWTAWITGFVVADIGEITGHWRSLAVRIPSEALPIISAVLAVMVIQRLTTLQRIKIGIATPAQQADQLPELTRPALKRKAVALPTISGEDP